MCHRRFLDRRHRWRKDEKCFDGTKEIRVAPKLLTGSALLRKIGNRENSFGKIQKRKRKNGDPWLLKMKMSIGLGMMFLEQQLTM
jgi:hypothetical protein